MKADLDPDWDQKGKNTQEQLDTFFIIVNNAMSKYLPKINTKKKIIYLLFTIDEHN